MKKFLLLLLIPTLGYGQINYSLDNNITGTYATTKVGDQPALMINGSNHFDRGNFVLDINPYYSLKYTGTKQIDNEFLTREDIGYKEKDITVFAYHEYNSSLIRSISSDNWIGLGVGKKYVFSDKLFLALSYCSVYEYRRYSELSLQTILRNSFRAKLKLTYPAVAFSFEYYYQPSVNDMNDYNMFGSSSISLFPGKTISFVAQNTYNFISTDKVKTIQSTSFGFKIKVKSKNEKS
jgi:hypothetical protein